VRIEIDADHGAPPYLVEPTGTQVQAALRALRAAFGHRPALIREGGSIPIVSDFKQILGVDTLLLGLALPDDNAHSPNEKFDLDCFAGGQTHERIALAGTGEEEPAMKMNHSGIAALRALHRSC